MSGNQDESQHEDDQHERFEDRFYSWKLQRELTWGVVALACLTGTIQLIPFLEKSVSWFSLSIDAIYLALSFGFSYSIWYLGKLFRTNPQNAEPEFYTEKLRRYFKAIEGKHYSWMSNPTVMAVTSILSFALWLIILLSRLELQDLPHVIDPSTFIVSAVGITISSIYILSRFLHHWNRSNNPDIDEKTKKALTEMFKKLKEARGTDANPSEALRVVLDDYDTSTDEIGRRDNILLLVGTILIGSSLLTLGNVAQKEVGSPSHFFYALGSIGLYAIYLLVMHETAVPLNALTYKRMKAIEVSLTDYLRPKDQEESASYKFGIHSHIYTETHGGKDLWLCLRRSFWGILLLFLSLVWMLSSLEAVPV
jgi:hypothetical protein